MKNKNYYEILGIDRKATKAEIKKAYFKLAHIYHPDKNKDENSQEIFIEINKAYETLSNDLLKIDYDNELERIEKFNEVEKDFTVFSKKEETSYQKRKNSYFDLSLFTEIISAKVFDKEELKLYLSKLSIEQVIATYSCFWLNFWGNNNISHAMIDNHSVFDIFQIFMDYFYDKNIDLYELLKNSYKTNKNFNKYYDIMEAKLEDYRKSWNAVNNGISLLNNYDAKVYVLDLLKNQEMFNEEAFIYYTSKLEPEINKFLEKFVFLTTTKEYKERKTKIEKTIKQIKKEKYKIKSHQIILFSFISFIVVVIIIMISLIILVCTKTINL